MDELKERIEAAFQNLDNEMVRNSFEEYRRRLEVCIERNGESVETYQPLLPQFPIFKQFFETSEYRSLINDMTHFFFPNTMAMAELSNEWSFTFLSGKFKTTLFSYNLEI